MRRRVWNAPAVKAVEEGEQSYQEEVPPTPPHKRRGRGRPRAAAAQEVEQEHPPVEQEAPEVNQEAFAAGMAGINQDLEVLNQAIPLIQQMLQQRNQGMSDADVALLYSRVWRVFFYGTRDALDFLNTVEARTQIVYTNY